MAIRVILLDIDGTLTNSKKEITPRTREALKRAQDSGAVLALCSGRPEQGLYRWARELEMDRRNGLFVCFNGAKVVNCQTREVLFNQTIPVEEAQAVLSHMKNFRVVPMIDRGAYMYVTDVFNHDIHPGLPHLPEVWNIMQYEARGNGYLLCEVPDLSAFADFPINKILTYADPEYLKAHAEAMAEPFKNTLNCMFTAPYYFEFTAQGVDKAKAISEALRPLGYSREEIIAFGDAQNDASMLQYAGIGVAMGNAVEEVKALADEVTLSNEEDGIAVSLEMHMPEVFG